MKKKKAVTGKKPVKKAKKKKVSAIASSQAKETYLKCIDLIVRVNEMMVDGMDDKTIDNVLDQIAECRKELKGSKNEVVGRLLKSLTAVTDIEIDEASPGSGATWD